jgi:hypothetical protein
MENETITKKAEFYKKQQIFTHIGLNNGKFYNGLIQEVGSDFLIIHDRILGEMPVFFIEISSIEPYNKIKKEGNDG